MERVDRILAHPLFCEQMAALKEDEKDRPFCKHGLEHLLDVARIMYIYSLEEGADISQELLYGAALLHDIGRHKQYLDGTPHETAGAEYARVILKDCRFSEAEQELIAGAISGHRQGTGDGNLADYLYRADKASRACFACEARAACNWPEEKMNLEVGV